ncbi:hypothetical protein [Bergeriella denitrificans]|uniref:Uncharacterized protein n=2 Tax=Bergeriella denitrificans TaxID=494 RepID=A0A378UIM4_BERDE|nr:hypothetical protein [Bergeriella denitrificans]STZ76332.1 Uncharacterised protein [Bergeriella denitrificans]
MAKQTVKAGATAEVNPEDTALAAALQQKLDEALAENRRLLELLAQAEDEKQDLAAALAAADKAADPAEADDETMQVRTASGKTFWRCGLQFDGSWREIERADVGDDAWSRILAEPQLQTKKAK